MQRKQLTSSCFTGCSFGLIPWVAKYTTKKKNKIFLKLKAVYDWGPYQAVTQENQNFHTKSLIRIVNCVIKYLTKYYYQILQLKYPQTTKMIKISVL